MNQDQKHDIYEMFNCQRGARLYLNGFLSKFFKINPGNEGEVQNLAYDKQSKNILEENLILSINCKKERRNEQEIIAYEYFSIESDKRDPHDENKRLPLHFYVVLDIYSQTINTLIKGSSLIAFYLGIVLLVGFRIKAALEVKLESIKYITIVENRFILTLIESIEIARADKNYVKEKLLFIYLLAILRSDNIFNKVSGSLNPSKYKKKFAVEFKE